MEQWPTLSPTDRPELSLQKTPDHKFASLLEVDLNPNPLPLNDQP